jgi:hypothetical protein
MPMAWHLDRTELVVDVTSAVRLASLQRPVAEKEPRLPFAPYLMCRAGTLVLKRDSDQPARYSIFEVLSDVVRAFGNSDPDLLHVRPFSLNGVTTGVTATLDLRDIVTLRTLVFEAEAQYQNPPDQFLYIVRVPPIIKWDVEVVADAMFPTKQMQGRVHATLSEGALSVEMEAAERPLFAGEPPGTSTSTVYRTLIDGSIKPLEATMPSWRLGDTQYIGVSHDSRKEQSQFKFRAGSLNLTFSDGTAVATREMFRGINLKVFSHRIVPDDLDAFDYLMARNTYALRLLERDSRILQVESGYVALIHEGNPFLAGEIEDIQTVLQYLCGNRAQHLSTEKFDSQGRLTFEFRERSSPTSISLPPLRLDPWSSENADRLATEFPSMVLAAHKLRTKSPNGIAAAFHHYFEGANSSYPVSRTLMLAVAIDALIAAHVGNQKQVFMFDKPVFRTIVRPLRKAAKQALAAAKINEVEAKRFVEKLNNLNNASVAQRQSLFWTELGIQLSDEEVEILKSRHNVVHEGHLGFEHSPEALEESYRRSNVLATLFNRAMLSLLGWTGPCLDLTDYERQREIACRSAAASDTAT